MSSSDSEEFFDATDVTPQRIRTEVSAVENVADEEKNLVKTKKLIDIRQKLGDEALEKQKLRDEASENQVKEIQECQAQLRHQDQDGGNNIKRRKKLEQMRKSLESSTPHSHPQLSSRHSIQSHDQKLSHDPILIESQSEGKDMTVDLGDTDSTETDATADPGDTCLKTDPGESGVGTVTEHINQLGIDDALEPDLIQSVKSSSLGRSKSMLDSPQSETLPIPTVSVENVDQTMAPPPLIPPRRKKKDRSSLDQSSVSSFSSQSVTRIHSSPPDQLTIPSSRQPSSFLLTAPSPMLARKPLNLSDMTGGGVMVTACEAEDTRAVNDVQTDAQSIYDTESIASECVVMATSLDPSDNGGVTEDTPPVRPNVMRDSKSHSFPRGQRPLSGSGLSPDQQAMLDTMSVLNLDTGERIPLSVAEEKLPASINPLSLHIMRRTKEYLSDSSLNKHTEGAEVKPVAEGAVEEEASQTVTMVTGISKRKKKLKSLFGKAKNKLKSVKDDVFHNTESSSEEDEEDGDRRLLKIKASKSHKGPYDFDLLVPVQFTEGAHNGAVWTMKFSPCGRLLGSGGQDNLLRVWVLKDAYTHFDDMRLKYSEEQKKKCSPAVSEDSLPDSENLSHTSQEEEGISPFNRNPFCTYRGHTADILDISWSKNYFILTSSMDKTVRLWHVSRRECLCCFQHIDFVTAISFHPKDDRYFLSGSLDGKLRLWSIPERKVELWNEVSGSTKLITAANFCMKGKFAVVGTYDGRCVFYSTEQLKYYTQIHVRSTRGKNSKGRKITGVEPLAGEDKILVTSNDSRVRIYDLRDLTLTCKYKGCVNNSSQIKAGFSHDGRFIVCGSEDQFVYIWRTQHDFHKFSSARRDRSDYWEAIKAHSAVVTSAIFAPKPNLVIRNQFEYLDSEDKQSTPEVRGEVLISADYNGTIKYFINKFKPVSV